jgi:hypothetical protein
MHGKCPCIPTTAELTIRPSQTANWARIRAELGVLDVFLGHGVSRKSADSSKRSLNPFQGVILEASDALASLAQDRGPIGADMALQKEIRTLENEIASEPAGISRLGYLSATLGLQRFEERCLVLALAPELYSRYSEIYAYLQDNVIRTRPTIDLALQLFSTHPDDRMAFTAGAPLMRSRLLLEHEPGGSPLPMSQRTLSLDDRVLGFLLESLETDVEIEGWANLVPVPKGTTQSTNPSGHSRKNGGDGKAMLCWWRSELSADLPPFGS